MDNDALFNFLEDNNLTLSEIRKELEDAGIDVEKEIEWVIDYVRKKCGKKTIPNAGA